MLGAKRASPITFTAAVLLQATFRLDKKQSARSNTNDERRVQLTSFDDDTSEDES
jgi:hypothetical protein